MTDQLEHLKNLLTAYKNKMSIYKIELVRLSAKVSSIDEFMAGLKLAIEKQEGANKNE